jgi:protein-disulfide isomerase
LRVEGTPTVILNGIRFQGAPPAAVFHDKIDSLLGRGK